MAQAAGKDALEVQTADAGSEVLIGDPLTVTLPADAETALDSTWRSLGLLSDPPDFSRDTSSKDVPAWNSDDPVKSLLESDISKVTLSLMQFNEDTFELYFGKGTWQTAVNNSRRWTPASGSVEVAVALVLTDGAAMFRRIWANASVSEVGTFATDKADAVKMEVTLTRLAPPSGTAIVDGGLTPVAEVIDVNEWGALV